MYNNEKTNYNSKENSQYDKNNKQVAFSKETTINYRNATPDISKVKIKPTMSSVSINSTGQDNLSNNNISEKVKNKKSISESKSYNISNQFVNKDTNTIFSKSIHNIDEEGLLKHDLKAKENELTQLTKAYKELKGKLANKKKALLDKKKYYETISSSNSTTLELICTKITSFSKKI